MLEELTGRKLRVAERFAWHADDGSPPNLGVGSVHLWFDDGRCAHLDAASDWRLNCSVSDPGDGSWMGQYLYEHHGRWVLRDASAEEPFAACVGAPLTSSTPTFDQMDEVVGITLVFGDSELPLRILAGEIDTSPH